MEQFDEQYASQFGSGEAGAGFHGRPAPGDGTRQAPVQGVTAEEQYLAEQQAAYAQQHYAAQQQAAQQAQQAQQMQQQAPQSQPQQYAQPQQDVFASAPQPAASAPDAGYASPDQTGLTGSAGEAPVGFLADLQQAQQANEQLGYRNNEQHFIPAPEQLAFVEQQFAQTDADYAAYLAQQQAAQQAEQQPPVEQQFAQQAAAEQPLVQQPPVDQQAAQQFTQQPPAFAQGQQLPVAQPAADRFPLPRQTRVFAISNQKGGVGKTTSAVNLAVALAQAGARVLVIDLDPQGNASTALGVDHRSEVTSVYDVIVNDVPLANAVQSSAEAENLFCVPATIHLAGAEIELVSLVAREQRLRAALARFLNDSATGFHYVFIDCPPSLGLLTINAFVAANEVLIPIQCEYYALEGLSQLLTNIELIQKHLNPQLRLSTILLTMFDSRTKLAAQVAEEVRQHFPRETLNTIIPRSVRVSEAPSYGQTVITYDNGSIGSLSYLEAASEIAQRGVQG